MKTLKSKHKIKLQKYKDSINKQVQEIQSKKLYEFMIINMPFIDDYHITYTSHTDRVSDAKELGDILLAGMQDLVSIVTEDALGIKDYELIEVENTQIEKFRQKLEDEYPLYVLFDVSDPITNSMQKLEKNQKTNTTYYKKLKTLQEEIAKIREVLNLRHKIQSHLRALEWKFIKINTAIGFIKIRETPDYSDIQRLEDEAREICQKLIDATTKYDISIKKLYLLKI